jgi:hypothetical protein
MWASVRKCKKCIKKLPFFPADDDFHLELLQEVFKAVVATVDLRAGRNGVVEAGTEPVLILIINVGFGLPLHAVCWCRSGKTVAIYWWCHGWCPVGGEVVCLQSLTNSAHLQVQCWKSFICCSRLISIWSSNGIGTYLLEKDLTICAT